MVVVVEVNEASTSTTRDALCNATRAMGPGTAVSDIGPSCYTGALRFSRMNRDGVSKYDWLLCVTTKLRS